jgi:putative transposase
VSRPLELNDAFSEGVQPFVSHATGKKQAGCTRKGDRQTFEAILYVLRTGQQWNALPRELGANTTVYDRFRFWLAAEFFHQIWGAVLTKFDELVGIE